MTRLGVFLLVALAAAPASGQSLSATLADFAAAGARLEPDNGHLSTVPAGAASAADLVQAIGTRLVSFPTVPAWGAPLGLPGIDGTGLRMSGAAFGETAAVAGARRFRLSIAHQGTEFGSLDDYDLRGTGLVLLRRHSDQADLRHGSAADGDVLEQVLSMDLDRRVTTVSAAVAVGERFDIGVILPLVQVNVQARLTSFIRRADGSPDAAHVFDALELANRTTYGDWTRNGLGDVELRTKLRLGPGLALAAGVRMPTGDEEDWLGVGAWQVGAGAIWSGTVGAFGPRVHAAYTVSGERDDDVAVPDEITFGFGIDAAVAPRVMLTVDAVGRTLVDAAQVRVGPLTLAPIGGAPAAAALSNVVLAPAGTTTLTGAFGAAGGRVLLSDRLLLNADFVFPLGGKGLTPKMGIVAGLNLLF